LPRRRLQIHERWAGTAVLRRPSQLPRPTSAVAQARPSSPTWHPPRTAAAASFLVALRKKALKEQATARCPDILSLLTDETMGGSARSSSQSPPGTDAGAGHRGQPVGGDGPCGSEERKPLHRTDPANSTSLHTSSSRYICSTYSFALSTSNFV